MTTTIGSSRRLSWIERKRRKDDYERYYITFASRSRQNRNHFGGRGCPQPRPSGVSALQTYYLPQDLAAEKQAELEARIPKGFAAPVEQAEVIGLDPPEQLPPSIPTDEELAQMREYDPSATEISDGKYKYYTPEEALDQDKELALVELFHYLIKHKDALAPEETAAIIHACKRYMTQAPERVQSMENNAQKFSFLRLVDSFVDGQALLKKYGYYGFGDFECRAAQSAVDKVVQEAAELLAKRGRQ